MPHLQIPPTPEQIARHGHIAVLLRRYLDQTGMRMADFHEHVMHMARNASAGTAWLNAKGCPGISARRTLSRGMGVPEDFFQPRDPDNPRSYPEPPETLKVPSSWTSRGHPADNNRPTALPGGLAAVAVAVAEQPVLSFAFYADNTVSVRLQADKLDGDHGKSLLRVLLEAGLVNPDNNKE